MNESKSKTKFSRKVKILLIYIKARLLFGKYYDKKYLDTEYFAKITSPGWEWAVLDMWGRKHFDQNRKCKWPVHPNAFCPHPENVEFDPSSLNVFHSQGVYFQAINAKIRIGKKCFIAQNCGLITTNHDFSNLEKHLEGKDIVIGDNCWIGMNSVILPGVTLGNHTIVGAGSVVTKSFCEGNCVIAGNPAKVIRVIESIEEENNEC